MQIAETCTFQCLQTPTRKVEKLKWNFFLPPPPFFLSHYTDSRDISDLVHSQAPGSNSDSLSHCGIDAFYSVEGIDICSIV